MQRHPRPTSRGYVLYNEPGIPCLHRQRALADWQQCAACACCHYPLPARPWNPVCLDPWNLLCLDPPFNTCKWCIHIYTARTCTHIQMTTRTYARTYNHAYTNAHLQLTHIRAHTCTHARARARARACACTRTRIRTRAHTKTRGKI